MEPESQPEAQHVIVDRLPDPPAPEPWIIRQKCRNRECRHVTEVSSEVEYDERPQFCDRCGWKLSSADSPRQAIAAALICVGVFLLSL